MNVTRKPSGMIKRLVGDVLTLTLEVDQSADFELFTNLNREKQNLPFKKINDTTHQISLTLKKSGLFFYQIRYQPTSDRTWQWLSNQDGKPLKTTVQVDPAWVKQAIVYNVFVRFFKGKVKQSQEHTIHPGEGGTFDDVKAHLKDLKKLGINVLYFNPIHLIGELYRKHSHIDQLPAYLQPGSPYSIKDYKSIDPELTFDKDTNKHLLSDPQKEFQDLINKAHEMGIYVIMDVVFNHTAHDFVLQRLRPEWYLYKQNITSLEDPYLYPDDMEQGLPWGDPKHTMSPYDHGVWWEDAAQLNWEYMIPEGPNQPPPNTSLKEMWQYFISIPKYWIRHFGVDGFRCDIAYRVPPDFWKACITQAREEAQSVNNNLSGDVVFIAESYTNDLDKLQEAGFTAVYGDYSHKLASPLDIKGYLDYLYNQSGSHFPDGSRWFIFPESHDFGRAPQKIRGDQAGDDPQKDLRANQSRWLLTATLPGIPLIFNGFEKIEWQPINFFSYGAVDWERDTDLREFIAKVNHLRHKYTALQSDNYQHLKTNQGLNQDTQLFCYCRSAANQTIIVVINLDVEHTAGPAEVYLPERFHNRRYQLTDLLTDEVYHRSGSTLTVKLDPGQGHLFLLE